MISIEFYPALILPHSEMFTCLKFLQFEVGPIALQNQINCKKAQRIEDIITFKTAQYERR